MKRLTNYASFPESRWCSQAHFLVVEGIQKVRVEQALKGLSNEN
jgi:hypothetical protein